MRNFTFEGTPFLSYSWVTIYPVVLGLKEQIDSSNYNPDAIVGILRGGAVVAHMLTDLGLSGQIFSIRIKSYDDIGKQGNMVVCQKFPEQLAECKRLLLVDDISDHGETFEMACHELERFQESHKCKLEVRTAALHIKEHTNFVPNFRVRSTSSDTWVVYPWESAEVAYKLTPRIVQEHGPQETLKILKEELLVPGCVAEKILSDCLGQKITI